MLDAVPDLLPHTGHSHKDSGAHLLVGKREKGKGGGGSKRGGYCIVEENFAISLENKHFVLVILRFVYIQYTVQVTNRDFHNQTFANLPTSRKTQHLNLKNFFCYIRSSREEKMKSPLPVPTGTIIIKLAL